MTEATDEMYRSWIKDYGAVFVFPHIDISYVYRRLSRREYNAISSIEDECDRSDQVCNTCILFPIGWDSENPEVSEGLAGIPEVLCQQILLVSGILDQKACYEKYINDIQVNIESQMESVIDVVFHGGANFARYEDWSYDQLYDAYSRAVWSFEKTTGVKIVATPIEAEQQPQAKLTPAERAARMVQLQKKLEEQKAGGTEEMPEVVATTESMALVPMSVAMEKYNKIQKRIAMRAAAMGNAPS